MSAALRVRSRPPMRCALCHDRFGPGPHAHCDCGTVLHRECWAAQRGCLTLGCGGRAPDRPATEPVGPWLVLFGSVLTGLLLAALSTVVCDPPHGGGGTVLMRQFECWLHYLRMALLASSCAVGLLALRCAAASRPGFVLALLAGVGLGRMAVALVVAAMQGFTLFSGGPSAEALAWRADLPNAGGACLVMVALLTGSWALATGRSGGWHRVLAAAGAFLAVVGLAVTASHVLFVLAMP